MKKINDRKVIGAVLLLLAVVSACTTREQPELEPTPTTQAVDGSTTHPCDNLFYPLQADNQWIYQLNIDGEPTSQTAFTVSEVAESSVILTAQDYGSGVGTQLTVECNSGEIINFPVTELNMVLGYLDGQVDIEHVSGVFMPSDAALKNADWQLEWETEYVANGQLNTIIEGETFGATFTSSPVIMKWQVVSTGGTVSVPAGNFENVIHIERRLEIDVTELQAVFQGQNVNVSTTLTLETNLYFAPGVSLLKQELESATLRLFGVDFPLEAAVNLELTSYKVN